MGRVLSRLRREEMIERFCVGEVRRRRLVTFDVKGRPATFATAHEAAWKEAVRAEISSTGVQPPAGEPRLSVRMEFRAATPDNPNERWDIDNLVKPTLDAMEGVLGARAWRGIPQPADDRIDHLEASKRTVRPNELPGAVIEVWVLGGPDERRAST